MFVGHSLCSITFKYIHTYICNFICTKSIKIKIAQVLLGLIDYLSGHLSSFPASISRLFREVLFLFKQPLLNKVWNFYCRDTYDESIWKSRVKRKNTFIIFDMSVILKAKASLFATSCSTFLPLIIGTHRLRHNIRNCNNCNMLSLNF